MLDRPYAAAAVAARCPASWDHTRSRPTPSQTWIATGMGCLIVGLLTNLALVSEVGTVMVMTWGAFGTATMTSTIAAASFHVISSTPRPSRYTTTTPP